MERTSFKRDMVKDTTFGSKNLILEEERFARGFPSTWLQRNYTCSFCKRQFNSAQALGGHMNVHRRDRAMLRQPPSLIFPYPNPQNSNNYSNYSNSIHPFSSASTTPFSLPPPKNLVPYSNNHPSFMSPPLSSLSLPPSCHLKQCSFNPKNAGESNKGFTQKYARKEVSKEGGDEVISLDLEMGCKDPAEALDLELRLGCF